MKKIFVKLCIIIPISLICVNICYSQIENQELEFSDPVKLDTFYGKRTSHQCVVVNNTLYVLGGYFWDGKQTIVYKNVQFANLPAAGQPSQLKWNFTKEMNTRRTGPAAVSHNGFLYVIGGSDENWKYLNSVEYSKPNVDGSIRKWIVDSNKLNIPRSNLSAGVFVDAKKQAYLYAIGGVGEVGTQTVHFPSIEYAPIRNDGSLGKWTVAAYNMKGGRSAPAALICDNSIYVIGGWGDLLFADIFSDIQYAGINEDGTLNPWYTSPYKLWFRSYGHSSLSASVSGKKYIFVIAGSLGQGNNVDFIQYARVNTGTGIAPVIIANKRIDGRRWGQSAIYHSNFMIITGGSNGSNIFMNDVQLIGVKVN